MQKTGGIMNLNEILICQIKSVYREKVRFNTATDGYNAIFVKSWSLNLKSKGWYICFSIKV